MLTLYAWLQAVSVKPGEPVAVGRRGGPGGLRPGTGRAGGLFRGAGPPEGERPGGVAAVRLRRQSAVSVSGRKPASCVLPTDSSLGNADCRPRCYHRHDEIQPLPPALCRRLALRPGVAAGRGRPRGLGPRPGDAGALDLLRGLLADPLELRRADRHEGPARGRLRRDVGRARPLLLLRARLRDGRLQGAAGRGRGQPGNPLRAPRRLSLRRRPPAGLPGGEGRRQGRATSSTRSTASRCATRRSGRSRPRSRGPRAPRASSCSSAAATRSA